MWMFGFNYWSDLHNSQEEFWTAAVDRTLPVSLVVLGLLSRFIFGKLGDSFFCLWQQSNPKPRILLPIMPSLGELFMFLPTTQFWFQLSAKYFASGDVKHRGALLHTHACSNVVGAAESPSPHHHHSSLSLWIDHGEVE